MKRFVFVSFVIFALFIDSNAQLSHEISHLKFLDIPITGELDAFVSRVVEKNRGFIVTRKHINDFKNFTSTELKGGKFWKFGKCTMYVRYNNDIELVTSVIVNCNEAEKNDFEDILMSLEKKYGEGIEEDMGDGWKKYIYWVNNDGRIVVTEAKKNSLISIKFEDFPEASIEAEKEMRKILYKGYAEDADL